MAGRHTAGKHTAAEDRRTWGRRNSRPRLGNGEDLLWLSPACQCQVACFGHRANGSGMHSGMRAAHRPVEQHRPGTDHAGQRRGGAPSAGAPVTSPARPRRRDPRDGRYDPLSLQLGGGAYTYRCTNVLGTVLYVLVLFMVVDAVVGSICPSNGYPGLEGQHKVQKVAGGGHLVTPQR